jgi:hypothetical protein
MAGADLFWEKSTAGWLLMAGLLWEKSTAGWWLISQANRALVLKLSHLTQFRPWITNTVVLVLKLSHPTQIRPWLIDKYPFYPSTIPTQLNYTSPAEESCTQIYHQVQILFLKSGFKKKKAQAMALFNLLGTCRHRQHISACYVGVYTQTRPPLCF